MKGFVLTLAAALFILPAAFGHFVYLVPEEGGNAVKAVFSDTLKPDQKVSVEKIEKTKLILLDSAGKVSELKWALDKAGSFYQVEVAGSGVRIVAGVTDYGVLQRGDSKPFALKYYSKAIVGDWTGAKTLKLGERVPLELVPILTDGKIRFLALAGGKPLAKAEITVMAPGEEESRQVVSDDQGLTPQFEKAGLYGINLRQTEAKAGEQGGKKFEEVRSYATLVVQFAPPK